MLLVKTRLGSSAIEGIGLFAAAAIPKGTVTWRFIAGFDQLFTAAQIDKLPEPARGELRRYVYLDERSGKYVFCLDNARFMNHSEKPNTESVFPDGDHFGHDVATRDIAAGDELTCDYRDFDQDHARKLG
jgi:uncharacterized protein